MDEQQLREEICRVGKSLFDRGYVHATAGNISTRLDDGILITTTDASLGFLEPGKIAKVDRDGAPMGSARPSKTIALHRRIYAADPAARCVIHTHSTHLVSLCLAGAWTADDIVPPITPYFVMKVGHVPLIAYQAPGDPRGADLVAAAIARFAARGAPIRAVMLDRIGPNVWHESPAAARATLEEREETAKLWLLAGRTTRALEESEIEQLRKMFGARW